MLRYLHRQTVERKDTAITYLRTLILSLALVVSGLFLSPTPTEAHVTNYGHWYYYNGPGWSTYCAPYEAPESEFPGTPNCYWPSSTTAQCVNHQNRIYIRLVYVPSGDWHLQPYYYGSC